MTPIVEKPVLFNADMVRAILAGRKTQTRRPLRNGKHPFIGATHLWVRETHKVLGYGPAEEGHPPCVIVKYAAHAAPRSMYWQHPPHLAYLDTDGTQFDARWEAHTRLLISKGFVATDDGWMFEARPARFSEVSERLPWTPAIHMPRPLSRITLRVKRTWTERLHDMSEADARAEGFADCVAFHAAWFKMYPEPGDISQRIAACEFEVTE